MEDVSNVIQMIVLIVTVVLVWLSADRTKEPTIARFFSLGMFVYFLGTLFWSLYILLFGEATAGVSPADIGWIGAYCFLIGFLQITAKGKRRPKWLIIMPVLVACDTAVWISWAGGNVGSILNDVVYGIIMQSDQPCRIYRSYGNRDGELCCAFKDSGQELEYRL